MKATGSLVSRLTRCWQRTRRGKVLVLIPVLALFCLGVTTQVFAATHRAPAGPQMSLEPLCSGYGCDDRDPYATRCAGQSWDQVITPVARTQRLQAHLWTCRGAMGGS